MDEIIQKTQNFLNVIGNTHFQVTHRREGHSVQMWEDYQSWTIRAISMLGDATAAFFVSSF